MINWFILIIYFRYATLPQLQLLSSLLAVARQPTGRTAWRCRGAEGRPHFSGPLYLSIPEPATLELGARMRWGRGPMDTRLLSDTQPGATSAPPLRPSPTQEAEPTQCQAQLEPSQRLGRRQTQAALEPGGAWSSVAHSTTQVHALHNTRKAQRASVHTRGQACGRGGWAVLPKRRLRLTPQWA